jgi:hypothetical protein
MTPEPDCNCEQALALKAENAALREHLEDPDSCLMMTLERNRLRELAGETAAIIRARGDDEEQDEEGEAWLARAKALGVPCR